VSSSCVATFVVLSLTVPLMLRNTITQSMGISLASQAFALSCNDNCLGRSLSRSPGSVLRVWASANPPASSITSLDNQGKKLLTLISALTSQPEELRRDYPSLTSWLGGYWLAVQNNAPPNKLRKWVYASPGTSMRWLWPAINTGSVLLGSSLGTLLFLLWQVQRPIQRLLLDLPSKPSGKLALVPESGMAPIRELCIRINRLLATLNQQNEIRRHHLHGVAHDLASPLTRLSIRAERIEQLEGTSFPLTNEARMLRTEIDRMIALNRIIQMLADEQREIFNPQLIAIDEICQSIAASYSGNAIELAGSHVICLLDLTIVERALQNLIDNALKHGRPPIRLTWYMQEAKVVLQVEDSGSGLSGPYLLDRPPRAAANDHMQLHHSRMGLKIVERCCDAHGGHLVFNRSILGGLQVELHLPQR
jgi:signal transduction histidine kinase